MISSILVNRGIGFLADHLKLKTNNYFSGLLVLGLLLAITFLPVTTGRQSLLPIQSGVLPDGPFGYTGPRPAPAVFDPAASAIKYYPLTKYASECWKQGALPFWNPFAGGGTPLLANAENFALAPLRLPLYASPTPAMWNAWWLARLLLAGGLAFLLALRLSLPFLPALTAGTAYMLSGYMVLSLNLFHLDVDIILPGFLLALDILLVTPSRTAFLASTAAWWLMCLGGSQQALAVDFVLALAWAAVRLARIPQIKRSATVRLVGLVLAAGIAGAMVHWAPMFELMFRSHHLHSAGSGRSGIAAIPPSSMLNLPGNWAATGNSIPFYYAGLSVLLLAVFGAISAWRGKSAGRGPFLLLSGTVVVELAKIFGFPGFAILGSLPLFELVWWVKYCAPLFLALALLAGFGAGALTAMSGRKSSEFAAVVILALVWGELTLLRPGPHAAPHDPLTPAPYVQYLQKQQALAPDKYLCGIGTAFMPMTATAFHLKDIRMEDTLIDGDQYKTLYEGFSAPKAPRYSMFMTLDTLDRRRLEILRKLGVRWLVAEPGWKPLPALAGQLEPGYQGEMNVWLVSGSRVFHGFPPRGKTAFLLGLWITLLITPGLVMAGLRNPSCKL